MGKLTMSRRSFAKLSAMTAASVMIAESVAPAAALADDPTPDAHAGEIKRIRSCCRGCGKMECGVWVTVQNGRVIKTEGDQSSSQSSGNHCAKGQASLQACYHPARIYHPLKRTNPKGEEPGWVRISWDEALQTVGEKFNEAIDKYGGTACFGMCGTSRQWVYGPYAFFKWLFDGPNARVASSICKGPRRLMGWMSSVDGAPWFALRDGPRVYVQWGTAPENSNYDDSCRNIVDKMTEADVHICIDPRLSGTGKEADYWLNLQPGTDLALALCWQKLVIDHDLVDWEFVKRWTNAPILVVDDMEPTGGRYTTLSTPIAAAPADLTGDKLKTRLLKEMDVKDGGSARRFMAWNKKANGGQGGLVYWDTDTTQWEGCSHVAPTRDQMKIVYEGTSQEGYLPPLSYGELEDADVEFDMIGSHEITLADGSVHTVRPVWSYLADSVKECTVEWCSEITKLDASLIEEACLAWATRPEGQSYGNGGIHLNLSPDQEGNCSQTVRAVLNLTYTTGNFDGPAGNRGLTRSPVDEQSTAAPGSNMPISVKKQLKGLGTPLPYYPDETYDITNIPDNYECNAEMVGADKYPVLAEYDEWCDVVSMYEAILTGDPYPIRVGINEAGSFMNEGNANMAWEALKSLDFWVDMNMFHHPSTEMADIILPVAHWLEINNIRVSQGASGGIGMTCRAVDPPSDVKFDYDVNRLLFESFEKQGNINGTWTNIKGDGPGAYDSDNRMEEWFRAHNEIDGFDTKYPGCKWQHMQDFVDDFQEHGWWNAKVLEPDRWGTYRRFETGWMRMGKDACTAAPWSANEDGSPANNNFGVPTASGLVEIWSVMFETYCIDKANEFEPGKFDPLKEMMPNYEPCVSAPGGAWETEESKTEYPIILTTGRRIPVYFHSEHRQLPWCRELWPVPRLELNPKDAEELGLEQGDWAWIEVEPHSDLGKNYCTAIRECVDIYEGIAPGWANAEHGWWFPELPAPTHGFDLVNAECLWDPEGQDKFIASSHMRGVRCKIYKATPENSPYGNPIPCATEDGTEIIYDSSDPRLKEWLPDYDIRMEA